MSEQAFANAVAYGQITPGPVTHTIALVGYAASGIPGALAATAIAFAPSFALVMLGAATSSGCAPTPTRAPSSTAPARPRRARSSAPRSRSWAIDQPSQWVVLAAAALALLARAAPIAVLVAGGLVGLATTV